MLKSHRDINAVPHSYRACSAIRAVHQRPLLEVDRPAFLNTPCIGVTGYMLVSAPVHTVRPPSSYCGPNVEPVYVRSVRQLPRLRRESTRSVLVWSIEPRRRSEVVCSLTVGLFTGPIFDVMTEC